MASATSATNKPVATIVNLTDAGLALPTFYLNKAEAEFKDESGKVIGINPQKIVLGAACDRDEAGAIQPDLMVNRYSFESLKKSKLFAGALANRLIDVRAPSLAEF